MKLNSNYSSDISSLLDGGDGIYSRTVDIYSFIQSCYGYDSF